MRCDEQQYFSIYHNRTDRINIFITEFSTNCSTLDANLFLLFALMLPQAFLGPRKNYNLRLANMTNYLTKTLFHSFCNKISFLLVFNINRTTVQLLLAIILIIFKLDFNNLQTKQSLLSISYVNIVYLHFVHILWMLNRD